MGLWIWDLGFRVQGLNLGFWELVAMHDVQNLVANGLFQGAAFQFKLNYFA